MSKKKSNRGMTSTTINADESPTQPEVEIEESTEDQQSEETEDCCEAVEEEVPAVKEEDFPNDSNEGGVKAPDPIEIEMVGNIEGESQLTLSLNDYCKNMMPGVSHVDGGGAVQQVKFFRVVQVVLRKKGSEFNKEFTQLLAFVHAHKDTLFNERYAYRFFESIKISLGERKNFERILNLLITVCDPTLRSRTLTQVDVDGTMIGFKDNEMHQRVLGFFSGV